MTTSENLTVLGEPISFQGFPSIPRLARQCVISEKIDGTNAQVVVCDDGTVLAASRSRIITPENDNFGFAAWVRDHEEELRVGLGFGRHFGEWWGAGVQRRYGLKEKRFSLFNTNRWGDESVRDMVKYPAPRPTCCYAVPVLYVGPFETAAIDTTLADLTATGSVAAPGFMNPEGVVIFHVAAGVLFKKTIGGDGHKGAVDAA